MTVAFSTTDKGATQVVTGGGLIVNYSGSGNAGLVRVTAAFGASGLYYWEWVDTATTGAEDVGMGICRAGESASDWGGEGTGKFFLGDTGTIYQNGAAIQTLTGTSGGAGTRWGGCFDATNVELYIRKGTTGLWNGSATADPVTNTGGISCSTVTGTGGLFAAGTVNDTSNTLTGCFDPSSWLGTPPAGATEINPPTAQPRTFAAILGRLITPGPLLPKKRRFFVPGLAF